jgi:hypothetical protein
MAELIWFLIPGYKTALLNMSYFINWIQDIWSIQQLNSSTVRLIFCSVRQVYHFYDIPTTFYYLTTFPPWSLACLFHGHDLLAARHEHQQAQPYLRCYTLQPRWWWVMRDDVTTRNDVTTFRREPRTTTKEWNQSYVPGAITWRFRNIDSPGNEICVYCTETWVKVPEPPGTL